MATQGIKLPEYLKSEQPASDNIPNQNNNTGIQLPKYLTEAPSNIRKYQYGWAKEDMVLGDVWDIGTAWINSWGEDTYKESVEKLLYKHKDNINIIKGNSNKVLKEISLDQFDYVFLDGGHKYETVLNDLKNLTKVIVNNKGVILCDDYDLTYAPGVKKAIDEYVLLNNFNLRILNSRFAEITKNSTEN